MNHTIDVPDIIWEWAQRKSGKVNPASWIRENCLYSTMISDIGGEITTVTMTIKETVEDRWIAMDMGFDPIDTEFAEARKLFADKIGGDEKAMAFLSRPSIHEPRGWLMDWWRKQKPQAV